MPKKTASAPGTVLAAWAKTTATASREKLSTAKLKGLTALGNEMLKLEKSMAKQSEAMKKLVARYDEIRLKEIPALLLETGAESVTLKGGWKIELKRDYFCSLTGKYRDPALAWLRANDLASLISRDVTASFGKGQEKQAEALLKLLAQKRFAATAVAANENVNTGTFKAVVREKLENGEKVPTDKIGVTIQDAARVIAPKAKKTL